MEFDCTKDGKNIYFACREKAAKYNDLLNSRERAAELLGISTSTLANHELGVTKNVPPDTVVMMSDLYKTRQNVPGGCNAIYGLHRKREAAGTGFKW